MSGNQDKIVRRASSNAPAKPQSKAPRLVIDGMALSEHKKQAAVQGSNLVDVCFVFDTTGSMYDKIDGLVNCMSEFVGELARLRLEWRVTVVPFGDLTVPGDRVVDDLRFVSTRDEAQQMLRTLPRFSGGGNEGESSLEAVLAACRKRYRQKAIKILVILTDEPPLESGQTTTWHVGNTIKEHEFICFVAAPDPRIQGPRVEGFRKWARETGGQWYPISSTMPTGELLKFLKSLVRDIPRVANKVRQVGSVRKYLELEGGKDS
ncbi:vWA domain-containing protein [Streptomyces xinghaiensis]|uniref:vWA domain-containing protein n=1 Tax=Streptomyces xinghaiensis TaxID=1038928 RepID=UPI0037873394